MMGFHPLCEFHKLICEHLCEEKIQSLELLPGLWSVVICRDALRIWCVLFWSSWSAILLNATVSLRNSQRIPRFVEEVLAQGSKIRLKHIFLIDDRLINTNAHLISIELSQRLIDLRLSFLVPVLNDRRTFIFQFGILHENRGRSISF